MSQPGTHPAAQPTEALLRRCQVIRGRASGPGGQHRNKVSTAVELRHTPTGVIGAASERRSQAENLRMATFRLRINLALTQRGHFNLRDTPSPLWQSRSNRQGHLAVNPRHADFPSLLAEALDVLAALACDPTRAAVMLNVSASQIIKLLKDEPRALIWLNEQRDKRGQHALR